MYDSGHFYFIEMNTRIQVEHPATEMIHNIDLIQEQIRIAANQPLSISQRDIHHQGHAIELRINAENPETFIPSPGVIKQLVFPGGPGVRVDSHLYPGFNVSHFFDPMIAKIIVHGKNRQESIKKAVIALEETIISGIETNIPTHLKILTHPDFIDGDFHIHSVENILEFKEAEPVM